MWKYVSFLKKLNKNIDILEQPQNYILLFPN